MSSKAEEQNQLREQIYSKPTTLGHSSASCMSHCYNHSLTGSSISKETIHLAKGWGKSRQQGCEAAGHVASVVRSREGMDAGAQITFSLHLVQEASLWDAVANQQVLT